MRQPWFSATTPDGRDLGHELLSFASVIGLERIAARRYSLLLLLGLYGGVNCGKLNPAKVIREIEILEVNDGRSQLKAATEFKHPPLKGLWHKHYLQDGIPSLARNLKSGIRRFGIPFIQQQVDAATKSGEEKYLTEEDCARIAHDAVTGNFERLTEASALTGEWIIFAKWQTKNYYLCLGTHDAGDTSLRSQIDTLCLAEFPLLVQLLSKNPDS